MYILRRKEGETELLLDSIIDALPRKAGTLYVRSSLRAHPASFI